MVQWLRIHLPMQETRDWPLVQEDLTCFGAIKAGSGGHNYEARALEPDARAVLLNPVYVEPALHSKRTTSVCRNQRKLAHSNTQPTQRNKQFFHYSHFCWYISHAAI